MPRELAAKATPKKRTAASLTEQWPDAHIETVGGREEVVIYTGYTWTDDGQLRELTTEEIANDEKDQG